MELEADTGTSGAVAHAGNAVSSLLLVTRASGIDLFLNPGSVTGYLGVRLNSDGKFEGRGPKPERQSLGTFTTAIDAAVSVTRLYMSRSRTNPTQACPAGAATTGAAIRPVVRAQGVDLHLSSGNSSGYRCVVAHKRGFRVELEQAGRKVKLGKHAKAVDAAVEYAKHVLDKMLQT